MTYAVELADGKRHKDVILSILERNFSRVPAGRYDWLAQNPLGPSYSLLLKHEPSGRHVGSISLFARRIAADGVVSSAFVCGDLVVDQGHRTLGPALHLLRAAIAHQKAQPSPTMLLTFPNNKSDMAARRAGFSLLSEVFELTQIIRTAPYLRRHSPAAPLLAPMLDPLWHVRCTLNGRGRRGLRPAVITDFDERFDELWQESKSGYSLRGERSRGFLEWRFACAPHAKYETFVLASGTKRKLRGYIVFRTHDKRVMIHDLGFREERALDHLLAAFFVHQKRKGMDSIGCRIAGSSALTERLRLNGYSTRAQVLKVLISAPDDQRTVQDLKSGNWYVTAGDDDV